MKETSPFNGAIDANDTTDFNEAIGANGDTLLPVKSSLPLTPLSSLVPRQPLRRLDYCSFCCMLVGVIPCHVFFWSFLPGLLSAFVAAIVSTEKMTNA